MLVHLLNKNLPASFEMKSMQLSMASLTNDDTMKTSENDAYCRKQATSKMHCWSTPSAPVENDPRYQPIQKAPAQRI